MGRQRFTPEPAIAKLREVDVIVGRAGRRSRLVGRSGSRSRRCIGGARNMVASRSTRCIGWGRRRPQGQRSGAGKCAAEEAGSGPRAGQGDSAGGVEADFLSPSRRREAIEQVRRVLPVSEQQTCRVLVQHRSTQRHRPKDPIIAMKA